MTRLQIFVVTDSGPVGIFTSVASAVYSHQFVLGRAVVGPNNKVIFVTVVDITYELNEGTCNIFSIPATGTLVLTPVDFPLTPKGANV